MGSENVAKNGALLFTDGELKDISGLQKGDDFVEVMCGCTSHRYGDAVGRLRVFANGFLDIYCECTPGCQEGKLTPAAFEKHSGRESARKWKYNIWVIINGDKVPILKTALLKYYNQSPKQANGSAKSQHSKVFHRDEFLQCTQCNKYRRFRLRSKEDCHTYHEALQKESWKCSDMALGKITCDADEERASRKAYRGCSRSPTCKGCTSCVCFGCELCRFSDCNCQNCIDFTRNVKA
ncbi:hypothetical protein Leryth_005962 [Lithospermum erythrorhizon]|uniref:SAND domain-containing protein n=1 Tax=Lithospermum erythrorhizon TaxID=34254 RepID=A0AAV3NTH2_LITER|nr:hypothetical protein Leryth_005962 [Lithospermum erythrorhizon]